MGRRLKINIKEEKKKLVRKNIFMYCGKWFKREITMGEYREDDVQKGTVEKNQEQIWRLWKGRKREKVMESKEEERRWWAVKEKSVDEM